MRTAETKTVFDGHLYQSGEEIPDLGSFVAMPGSDKVRNYEGLAADLDKLKAASKLSKYDDLETGSSAFCVDTGEVHKYVKATREWYKLGGE